MKKLLIIALLLINSACYGALQGAWSFDSDGKNNDLSGNGRSLTDWGNGGTQITSPVYYGDRSFRTDKGNNDVLIPAAAQSPLASSDWTIQYQFYEPSTGRYDHRVTRGPYNPLQILLGSATATGFNFWYNNVNLGTYSVTPNVSAYNRVNLCYTLSTNTVKLYYNGNLVRTVTAAGNVFDDRTYDSNFHFGTETGTGYGAYGFYSGDLLIISNTDSAGSEITLATPTFTPTFTPSPTFTPTVTPTFTVTPYPTFISTVVNGGELKGYKITETGRQPIVILKSSGAFVIWKAYYEVYAIVKPNNITITPLY